MNTQIAKEFILGLYLRYPSKYPNSLSITYYDITQLPTFLTQFNLTSNAYIIDTFDDAATVFMYNPENNSYERVAHTHPLVPTASITHIDNKYNIINHGKLGQKKPLEKNINNMIYIADHWIPEYIYHYKVS
jgi:hypothetical protein